MVKRVVVLLLLALPVVAACGDPELPAASRDAADRKPAGEGDDAAFWRHWTVHCAPRGK